MKMNHVLVFMCFFLFCTSEDKQVAIDFKPDPDFTNAYIELLLLQDKTDPLSQAYEDSSIQILNRYHITPEKYEHTISTLNQRPEHWEGFLQHVLNQIQNKEKIPNKQLSDQEINIFNRAVD